MLASLLMTILWPTIKYSLKAGICNRALFVRICLAIDNNGYGVCVYLCHLSKFTLKPFKADKRELSKRKTAMRQQNVLIKPRKWTSRIHERNKMHT